MVRARKVAAVAGLAALALVSSAQADDLKSNMVSIDGSGCFDSEKDECFCGETQAECTGLTKSWQKDCACFEDDTGKLIEWKNSCWSSPWMGTDRWERECIWDEKYTATTGQIFKSIIPKNFDVVRVPSILALQNCDMSNAETLVARRTKAVVARIRFDNPGTYFLTTSNGQCNKGLLFNIDVTGEKVPGSTDKNPVSVEYMYAPDHANPGSEDDFQAFGKGVYFQKAYDNKLNEKCTADTWCLDTPTSKGSCYYMAEDYHMGWSTFCDVSEIECCGYTGCGDREGQHKGSDEFHGYFWQAPGFRSKSGCCYCAASCDMSTQDSMCSYNDVTHSGCQRTMARDGLDDNTIGDLVCKIPGRNSASDYVLRTGTAPTANTKDSAAAGVSVTGALVGLVFLGAMWAF